jgi:hypothetical protein
VQAAHGELDAGAVADLEEAFHGDRGAVGARARERLGIDAAEREPLLVLERAAPVRPTPRCDRRCG